MSSLHYFGRGLHNICDFVDIDQILVEGSVHGSQEEERTQKLQHQRLDHDDVTCCKKTDLCVVGCQHHIESET